MRKILLMIAFMLGAGGFLALSARANTVDGLVAAWNFDEGSGLSAQDSSGHGYNGQLVDGAGWTSGQEGFCGQSGWS